MQVLSFPPPRASEQERVIAVLETALDMAKRGEIASVVVVFLDDRSDTDDVCVMPATDSWIQTGGMLLAAAKAI